MWPTSRLSETDSKENGQPSTLSVYEPIDVYQSTAIASFVATTFEYESSEHNSQSWLTPCCTSGHTLSSGAVETAGPTITFGGLDVTPICTSGGRD